MRADDNERLRLVRCCKWLFHKEHQRGYWLECSRDRLGAAGKMPLNSDAQVPIYGSAV